MTSHSLPRLLAFAVLLWLIHGVVRGESVPSFASAEEALRHWEGFSQTPYQDNGSAVCVGTGHNLTAARDSAKTHYTRAELETFFAADMANAIRICHKGVEDFDDLPERIRQACISLAFQTGATGFMRFSRFRWLLSRRAYNASAVELCQSRWFRTAKDVKRVNWTVMTILHST